MRKLVALLSAALWLLVCAPAGATSCAPPTPAHGDEYADVVFEAVSEGDAEPQVAKLRVSRVYKGTVPEVVTTAYGGMKGFSAFERDKRYLVWGMVRDGGLFVSLCSPTHALPADPRFTEGAWADWSAESQYGPPHKPSGPLSAGPKGVIPTPSEPLPPRASSSPAPPPSASPLLVSPVPAPAADRSSCAGCAIPRGESSPHWLLAGLVGATLATRRRRAL